MSDKAVILPAALRAPKRTLQNRCPRSRFLFVFVTRAQFLLFVLCSLVTSVACVCFVPSVPSVPSLPSVNRGARSFDGAARLQKIAIAVIDQN